MSVYLGLNGPRPRDARDIKHHFVAPFTMIGPLVLENASYGANIKKFRVYFKEGIIVLSRVKAWSRRGHVSVRLSGRSNQKKEVRE